MTQKKGLGRGLGAYFDANGDNQNENSENIVNLDINLVEPNPDQPRKDFAEADLRELADSISAYGVLQPIIVSSMDGFYKIIAGERRYRAVRLLKLDTIPAIIRDYDELMSLQVALVENIQRKDLNSIEEAHCYKHLIDDFSMTQEELASKVSKSRSAVTNCLRLLNLERRVQTYLLENKLSMGHGRALLGLSDKDIQLELAESIIEDDLSVRATEELVKRRLQPKAMQKKRKTAPPHIRKIEDELHLIFGTKVKINSGKKKNRIEIEYYSNDDLDRLMTIFKH